MDNKIQHVGVLGMHWGHRKGKVGFIIERKKKAASLVESVKNKSVSELSASIKKPDLGERIAKSYGLTIKNGRIKSVGLDTFPKIMATAMVTHFAVSAVSDIWRMVAADMKGGNIPKWVGDIAWTTGKVISNTPLK